MYRRNVFIRVIIISIILVILTISCKSIAGKDKILVSPTLRLKIQKGIYKNWIARK